jgi:hypothetical protein
MDSGAHQLNELRRELAPMMSRISNIERALTTLTGCESRAPGSARKGRDAPAAASTLGETAPAETFLSQEHADYGDSNGDSRANGDSLPSLGAGLLDPMAFMRQAVGMSPRRPPLPLNNDATMDATTTSTGENGIGNLSA